MAATKDIKAKIKATERTHKVTRAMEAVSAVKMRKSQESAFAGRPYARAALQILARVSGGTDFSRHPLAQTRKVERVALLILTSDKGLAGALNSAVIKAAAHAVSRFTTAEVSVYAYGKKGEEYFSRRGYRIVSSFENKRDSIEHSIMEELSWELSEGYAKRSFDEVLVAYSNFKSTFEQMPTVRRLLPLSLVEVSKLVEDIRPAKGKWSDEASAPRSSAPAYTMEPTGRDVLNFLVPRLVAVSLFHFFLEMKASEHSARMVAMKNASDKSKEVAHDLTRLFNKLRQAAITREVSEIVGGREALAA